MSGVYLSDALAGTCGMADDKNLAYIRNRIQTHPYAGSQCKVKSLQKLDALCLAGVLTDEIAEAILREFDNNYATGKCNTIQGGGNSSGPQCPDGYEYDAARSVCVESQTTTTIQPPADWFSSNWPWLAAAVGLVVVYFITRRRR